MEPAILPDGLVSLESITELEISTSITECGEPEVAAVPADQRHRPQDDCVCQEVCVCKYEITSMIKDAAITTFCLKDEKFCVTHQVELIQKKVKNRKSIKTRWGTFRNGFSIVKTWICPARLDSKSEWSVQPGGQISNCS